MSKKNADVIKIWRSRSNSRKKNPKKTLVSPICILLTESSINVPLRTPLWAASRLFWNDTTWFVAPRPGTKHLAVVRKNSYFHAPILWTKQRHQTWMHKTLRLSLAWYGRCLVIALPTHVTNKWAYQETHDIFFIIVIHSAHRRHQPSLNVPVAIRTYDEDLHRKTVIPGISSPARYASRTSGMSSSLVSTDWKHMQT